MSFGWVALVISIDLGLAAERDDWREVAGSLLSAAEQRAQEALTAAGDGYPTPYPREGLLQHVTGGPTRLTVDEADEN